MGDGSAGASAGVRVGVQIAAIDRDRARTADARAARGARPARAARRVERLVVRALGGVIVGDLIVRLMAGARRRAAAREALEVARRVRRQLGHLDAGLHPVEEVIELGAELQRTRVGDAILAELHRDLVDLAAGVRVAHEDRQHLVGALVLHPALDDCIDAGVLRGLRERLRAVLVVAALRASIGPALRGDHVVVLAEHGEHRLAARIGIGTRTIELEDDETAGLRVGGGGSGAERGADGGGGEGEAECGGDRHGRAPGRGSGWAVT